MLATMLVVAILIVGIAFAGLGIKMFFSKDGTLKKTCSNSNSQNGIKSECCCNGTGTNECGNIV
jgi:hypothetical protein